MSHKPSKVQISYWKNTNKTQLSGRQSEIVKRYIPKFLRHLWCRQILYLLFKTNPRQVIYCSLFVQDVQLSSLERHGIMQMNIRHHYWNSLLFNYILNKSITIFLFFIFIWKKLWTNMYMYVVIFKVSYQWNIFDDLYCPDSFLNYTIRVTGVTQNNNKTRGL